MEASHALKTLKALRGHFRTQRPPGPPDLTQPAVNAEGIIHHCVEARQLHKVDLKIAKAEWYDSGFVAAMVPLWKGGTGPDAIARMNFSKQFDVIANATVIIMGHTHCGGVTDVLNTLLYGTQDAHGGLTSMWLEPQTTQRLSDAFKTSKKLGKDDSSLQRQLEKIMILQSMLNLLAYEIKPGKVSDLLKSGALYMIGGMREMNRDANGRQHLDVYDIETHSFRDIEAIHIEAGAPAIETLETISSPAIPLHVAALRESLLMGIEEMLREVAN